MKTLKPFGSFFYTLMVVFLLLLDVNLSFAAAGSHPSDHGFFFSKNNRLPAQADNQFLYEEKETEKDDELQDNLVIVYLPAAPILLLVEESNPIRSNKTSNCQGGVVALPLYITERSLLI